MFHHFYPYSSICFQARVLKTHHHHTFPHIHIPPKLLLTIATITTFLSSFYLQTILLFTTRSPVHAFLHLERNCELWGCHGQRGRSWSILNAPTWPSHYDPGSLFCCHPCSCIHHSYALMVLASLAPVEGAELLDQQRMRAGPAADASARWDCGAWENF